MSKLIKADDFQFQGPGGIFFDRIELILAIPDFDMIEVTARGESILLEFGDDIRMEFPSDQLLPLIVKIAAEASIESALQVIEGLGVDLLLRSGILVCEESVRPIQEQLDGIRGVYGLLLEAARGPVSIPRQSRGL
ncbi:MAG: hypothetical protein JAY75_22600 [Candidatus Thiodiazotropha taylori]|nr:hypothetical protein [Candidatus Thiodiazotropha taylori]MCW4311008.1 hypothetical protein [Candidatus Thiodiazotropha endolucinida]